MRYWTCDHEVADSNPFRRCGVPTPTQLVCRTSVQSTLAVKILKANASVCRIRLFLCRYLMYSRYVTNLDWKDIGVCFRFANTQTYRRGRM